MRIGQLARKYDIPVQEIISYLEERSLEGQPYHPNAKLEEPVELELLSHFGVVVEEEVPEPEPEEEAKLPTEKMIGEPDEEAIADEPEKSPVESPSEPLTAAEEIAAVEGDIMMGELEDSRKVDQSQPKPVSKDEIIQSDQLLELLDSDEPPADLEKIKLIKAPKRELAGLKVLGKVDLPEPKKKQEEKEETSEASGQKNRRPQLSEEEKEKRRLKAKRKKEAFEARQEKRRKEEENERVKKLKAAHYQEKLKKAEVVKQRKSPKPQQVPAPVVSETRPEPKTLLGKWWRWMNT